MKSDGDLKETLVTVADALEKLATSFDEYSSRLAEFMKASMTPERIAHEVKKAIREGCEVQNERATRALEKETMKKFLIASIASIAIATSSPSSAHYYRYRHYDNGAAGAALALGMFGAMAGAIIASQGYGYGYGGYAPPVYYPYPNSSYNPYAFGPAGCAAGFYWNGQECFPW